MRKENTIGRRSHRLSLRCVQYENDDDSVSTEELISEPSTHRMTINIKCESFRCGYLEVNSGLYLTRHLQTKS
jgi:hypothetical protein